MPIAPGPRVLSIKAPYAWAIATGRKKVENRDWSTPYRGLIYIHANSTSCSDDVRWLEKTFRLKVPDSLVKGAIVATAELVDVIEKDRAARFGRWFVGHYGWVLKDVQQLRRPVPVNGQQGLYRATPALKRAVERQLGPAHP